MNWITIHFCTDCNTQVMAGQGNQYDFCNCDDEEEATSHDN